MKIFVLLPAYNEAASIPALLPRIKAALHGRDYEVVLVDDGSHDETAKLAEQYGIGMPLTILRHPINRGLGETIRDGIEYCVSAGKAGDVMVRMDCDDSQDPSYIMSFIEKIRAGADVVVASRYQEGGGQSGVHGYRNWLSWGAGLFMKAFFPIKGMRDYSSGYRAYRWEILNRAIAVYGNRFIEQKLLGFSCTLEKVVKLDMLGARFTEAPHVLHYDRKQSESKMASWPTTLGYVLLALKYGSWCGVCRRQWRESINANDQSRGRLPSTLQPVEPSVCAASRVA